MLQPEHRSELPPLLRSLRSPEKRGKRGKLRDRLLSGDDQRGHVVGQVWLALHRAPDGSTATAWLYEISGRPRSPSDPAQGFDALHTLTRPVKTEWLEDP